jgi:hypothetical protein
VPRKTAAAASDTLAAVSEAVCSPGALQLQPRLVRFDGNTGGAGQAHRDPVHGPFGKSSAQ